MIKVFKGTLPWSRVNSNGKKITSEEVIKIRKDIGIDNLCINFPKEFIDVFKKILSAQTELTPPYLEIIGVFEDIKKI